MAEDPFLTTAGRKMVSYIMKRVVNDKKEASLESSLSGSNKENEESDSGETESEESEEESDDYSDSE